MLSRVARIALSALVFGLALGTAAAQVTLTSVRVDCKKLAGCSEPVGESTVRFQINGVTPEGQSRNDPLTGALQGQMLGLVIRKITQTYSVCDCQVGPGGNISVSNCTPYSHTHFEYHFVREYTSGDILEVNGSGCAEQGKMSAEVKFISINGAANKQTINSISGWVAQQVRANSAALQNNPNHVLTAGVGSGMPVSPNGTPGNPGFPPFISSIDTKDASWTHDEPAGWATNFGGAAVDDANSPYSLTLRWLCYHLPTLCAPIIFANDVRITCVP